MYFNLSRSVVNTGVMIILYLMPVYRLYSPVLITSETYNREKCLLRHTFYHPLSGECYPGLERGPCDQGQWLVPDPRDPGVARCHQTPANVGACHTTALLDSGELTCLENTDVMEAFTQAHCNTGDLLMPANFHLNKKPCPDKFHCSTNYLNDIREKRGSLLYGPAREYLRNLKCSEKDPTSVCMPDNGESPFLPKNIYQSFKNSKLVCKKNPCPHSRPTLDKNGYYICQNPLVPLWLGSVTDKCRRGQIFRRGRCVSRFFG